MDEKNYYGPNSCSHLESNPFFTLVRVVGLTLEEVWSISEQFRNWAVYYYSDSSDTILIAGHHYRDKFNFLGAGRVISWENLKGWPRGFSHLVIPPSQRKLNLTPFRG